MADIDPYSGVSIQTKFTGLDELFRMSGTILESDNDRIGDKTLLQIITEIKPNWNETLKTKTVEHLRGKLINHITGLKESMTAIFKDKPLSKGQMLLFDTAERKVTFNHNISITYKALGFENRIKESFEYLLINPRLVPVDNSNKNKDKNKDKSDKDVMKIIKGYIDGTTRQGTTNKMLTSQITQPGKIESIGITKSGFYMVNPKPINTLPTFDKDITIYMLAPFEDKGLLINDTVSIGVERDKFHTDFEIGTISSQRLEIHELIKNTDITKQIEIILNKRLGNYIPQIVKKYQTMDSLFRNDRDNVGQTLPIYQVLPNPSVPLNHYSEQKSEDGAIAILRTIWFYLLFKWMELYYDFYDFCLKKIPLTHENGKQTISDPLERCVDTLEFRMYKHQTELIKKSLLYVLYQLYDFQEDAEDKQFQEDAEDTTTIYTPEMLVYDLGKIIETHEIIETRETPVEPITAVNRSNLQRNTEAAPKANTPKKSKPSSVGFGTSYVDNSVKDDQKQVENKVKPVLITTKKQNNKDDLPEVITRPNPNIIPVEQQNKQTLKSAQALIKESSQRRQDEQLLKDDNENSDNDDSNSKSKPITASFPDIANTVSNRRNIPPRNLPPIERKI
jgi:predicted DNA-binding protein YlxM (UPF0122 family)